MVPLERLAKTIPLDVGTEVEAEREVAVLTEVQAVRAESVVAEVQVVEAVTIATVALEVEEEKAKLGFGRIR